jgi:hypothetical protein
MDIRIIIIYYSENPAEPLFQLLRGLFPVCDQCSEPGLTVLLPAPGIVIQLMSAGAQPPDFFIPGEAVICYAVKDLATAVDEAHHRGAEVLQFNTYQSTGFSFCYLRQEKVFGLFAV